MQTPILIDQEFIAARCPSRPAEGHKGTFGRVLLCAGTPGMGGAACMATASALRSGAGLVYVLTAKELMTPLMTLCPEALGLFYEEEKGPYAVPASSSMASPAVAKVSLGDSASATYPGDSGNSKFDVFFTEKLSGKDACLIGPGIPASSDTLGAMIRIAAGRAPHLVLDAGSLEYLASHEDVMQEVSSRISRGFSPAVMTPHMGEFARFAPGNNEDVMARASAFAAEKGVVLVLKNSETNIFTSDGKWYSNPVSNSGLAKGGSGDVLAGLLTGLLAQGMPEEDAAACAVGIHSLAGKLCAGEHGVRAMLPTMLPRYYETAFKMLKWEEGMEK